MAGPSVGWHATSMGRARLSASPASFAVRSTLVLFNNTLMPGNFLAGNGLRPTGAAYDSGKGEAFVANGGSDTVSVISDATNAVVATVAVGSGPIGVAYDSGKGEVFVANEGSDNVSVISDATNAVVATVTVGNFPYGVAYDSGKGEVFVANYYSDTVSVISDATNAVVATVAVGNEPYGVAYDSEKGEVFVANSVSDNVSVISDATNTVVATVGVGSSPEGVAYDSGKGEVFVANDYSDNVSVISDATNTVVTTVPVGLYPNGVAYDSGKREVFVANGGSGNVSVISDATDTVVAWVAVGSEPTGVAFDASNGYVYVTNFDQGTLSVLSAETPPTDYPVTFTESGLPAGTAWSVTLAGTKNSSTTSTITFRAANGTYDFTASAVAGYTPNPSSGTITVSGQAVGQSVQFTATTVSVTSTPTSGPVGTTIYVSAVGLAASTEYALGIQPAPDYGYGNGALLTYCTTDSAGAFTGASGAAPCSGTVGQYYNMTPGLYYLNVYVNSNQQYVTDSADTFTVTPSATYTVDFVESGLPSGTVWTVDLSVRTNSSSTSTIGFAEPNGTYSFTVGVVAGYNANPSSGSVTVNGAAVTVSITFSPSVVATYAVTFAESGLPAGTSWLVTLDGVAQSSATGSITFMEGNGTYSFSVGAVSGYSASPSFGSVTVNGGSPPTEDVTFTPISTAKFAVTVTETGLPTGTRWNVTLYGLTGSYSANGTGASILLPVPNGTYTYLVEVNSSLFSSYILPTGFLAVSELLGNVTVAGAPVSLAVEYSSVTFTETGLPSSAIWTVIAVTNLTQSVYGGTSGEAVFYAVGITAQMSWYVPFGSYTFEVCQNVSVSVNGSSCSNSNGYTPNPQRGTFTANGTPQTQSITFSRSGSGSGSGKGSGGGLPPILGLPGVEGYVVVGTTVAVAVIVGVLVALHTYAAVGGAAVAGGAGGRRALRRRRKGGKTPPPSGAAPPATSAGAPPPPPPADAGVGPPPPPVPPPSPPASAAPGASAVCWGCGKPYVGAEKFCTACGRPR